MRDRVVIVFAVALAACIVLAVAGLIALRLDDPHADLAAATGSVSSIVSVLVGYVVGSLRRSGDR